MKRKTSTSESTKKINYVFARVSTYTGYMIGLLAVFLFTVSKDPEGIRLIPIANLFFEAAKITMQLEEVMKESDKCLNQK
jgi:hypothetical protein